MTYSELQRQKKGGEGEISLILTLKQLIYTVEALKSSLDRIEKLLEVNK